MESDDLFFGKVIGFSYKRQILTKRIIIADRNPKGFSVNGRKHPGSFLPGFLQSGSHKVKHPGRGWVMHFNPYGVIEKRKRTVCCNDIFQSFKRVFGKPLLHSPDFSIQFFSNRISQVYRCGRISEGKNLERLVQSYPVNS